MEFAAQFQAYRDRVEQGLDQLAPPATTRPARLHNAMRYALLGGGKRLRPVLTLATADLFGSGSADALPAAVALECIHTYSLVHDDLPCMDNDDLRRGRPTTHKQFDEPTALLAGDALLTLAFQLVARYQPALATALTRELSDAAGSERLIGGQMEDLLAERKADATAALVAGGLCGGATPAQLETLRTIGWHLGLAFQIVDDILDATADTATLGKTAGKDARAGKTTYVKLHGLAASRRFAQEHSDAALAALESLSGNTEFLLVLVRRMAERTN